MPSNLKSKPTALLVEALLRKYFMKKYDDGKSSLLFTLPFDYVSIPAVYRILNETYLIIVEVLLNQFIVDGSFSFLPFFSLSLSLFWKHLLNPIAIPQYRSSLLELDTHPNKNPPIRITDTT